MGITINVLCCVTYWIKWFIPWSVQAFAGMDSTAPENFLSQAITSVPIFVFLLPKWDLVAIKSQSHGREKSNPSKILH